MALRSDAKVELLKKVPLFAGCSKGELKRLASVADEIDLREGTILTREGRAGHEFFVLIEGTVRVAQDSRTIAELGSGDWLGEISLLTKSLRTATVTATSPVRALVITERDFRRTITEMPSIAMKVLSSVADRLSQTPQS